MDTLEMKRERNALTLDCGAPCAAAALREATTITVWKAGWYVRRAWSGSPGGTFPESVAGRGERGRRAVTLYDLSLEYDSAAQALRERICRLEEEQNREKDGERRLLLAHRLRLLRSMWRDTREVARHLEHYYEKGVSRNEKYLIR